MTRTDNRQQVPFQSYTVLLPIKYSNLSMTGNDSLLLLILFRLEEYEIAYVPT